MNDTVERALAIVGVSAILPEAPDAATFWRNVRDGRYCIGEVPADRWDTRLYYDPDPSVPDKTYSKIGGWVQDWDWDPLAWRLPIPPKVADAMDVGQRWAVACARALLSDYGWPERELDLSRTAVVLGSAMSGERHYQTALRVHAVRFADMLTGLPAFEALAPEARSQILQQFGARCSTSLPGISEDTMPGELANCMAGRIANLFDLHGPNFVCDAACASALSAIDAASEGLVEREYDAVIVGGIDRNMGPEPFVKFCKIGALSATGTRPYGEGADGFVMGEGAAFFMLKRLTDAERSGDRIYAVIRGVAGASDGRGKGITAPNPRGQRLAIERAWRAAGISPAAVGMIEGHGTSTRVGDVVEVESLNQVFGQFGLPAHSIALGSVKSNIGHLKGAAGAAGLLKAVLALHHKELPPSLGCERPNPSIDFDRTPFYVAREAKPWDPPPDGVRRAAVSAFGFGGTNFHAVVEEYVPERQTRRATRIAVPREGRVMSDRGGELKAPLRGIALVGAQSVDLLRQRVERLLDEARQGRVPAVGPPREDDLRAPERIAIDFGNSSELAQRCERALLGLRTDQANAWMALRAAGVFRGRGAPGKLAFLYTGQGSQYPNMLRELYESEPLVRETFEEADRIMANLLPRPLSEYVFVDPEDTSALEWADKQLRLTEITQPAVLTVDTALTRLFACYGIVPDMVMGHSLGEYGALVAAGVLSFEDALVAVSARGRGMADLDIEDPGRMAAVFAPLEEIEAVVQGEPGDVVIANVNSRSQAVIGGATGAIERCIASFSERGVQVVELPVSHAFHTSIVAPASEILREALLELELSSPNLPLVGNVDGEFYPRGPDAPARIRELLVAQVASPVQFVRGLETLYAAGVRTSIEVGPKKALQGFAQDVLGGRDDFVALFSNHPKLGAIPAFNQALCGAYAAGLGLGLADRAQDDVRGASSAARGETAMASTPGAPEARYTALGKLFAEVLERGQRILQSSPAPAVGDPAVVSGIGLGLPGTPRVFDDLNIERILDGAQAIDTIPAPLREAITEKHITRLVKTEGSDPHFEKIDDADDVIKLAARGGKLDLAEEFGVAAERVPALDRTSSLAIAAGIEALRDAGIPLVHHYRTTSKGTFLPERWMLPEALRDETGVIFASAFPGFDSFADELNRYHTDRALRDRVELLAGLRARAVEDGGADGVLVRDIDHRLHELQRELGEHAYGFDRRFLFRILPMAHAQFAEHIGARGPNTHINSACASTTQAFALAEDWIRAGRCRQVVVIAADDATSDHLLEWIGAGFLATGAAATDAVPEKAALPFDRRRHGMLLGMGAAGFVIESPDGPAARGIVPICEVLGCVTANSAFHGTRLDVEHIEGVMERLVSQVEQRFGLSRAELARELLFVSHETYTPARGGSASAEVHALRRVFGDAADRIVVANTKGLTGHPMGVGIEDAVAVAALETGIVPPVPNFREPDPELGPLHLSRGGAYPIRFALRLGAGFGSQISMSLLRWTPGPSGVRPEPDARGYRTRVADPSIFERWTRQVSGNPQAELEVVARTLRVVDRGPAVRTPVAASAEWASRSTTVAAGAGTGAGQRDATRETPVHAAEPARTEVKPAPLAPADRAVEAASARAETNGAAAVTPPVSVGASEVQARVLAIVAEKTGYPIEMLEPDLDLEADLGIDTVKQAETFAAIRAAYEIARDDNLRLRDYPTLAHAVRFVLERRPDLAGAAAGGAIRPAPDEQEAPPPPTSPGVHGSAFSAESDEAEVEARVLAIVAEKTGYPEEMLEPDLDLEADLGIDTVKQAETFAAIREAYSIPRDENLRLRDYPTLAHAVRFVMERRPVRSSGGAGAVSEEEAAEDEPAPAADAIQLRVPVAVPRPPLECFRDTSVTLGSGQRVIVGADAAGIGDALCARLRERGVETLLLDLTAERSDMDALLDSWLSAGPVHGLYWLPALDEHDDLVDFSPEAWTRALEVRVKRLHLVAQRLYEKLGTHDRFLLCASRLGGRHGYGETGATCPLGGAVIGFTKSLARERPQALVKALDFSSAHTGDQIAELLIQETLTDPGAVEIGYVERRRFGIGWTAPERDASRSLSLGPASVFVVTGAAGSIVSEIVSDFARASGGSFHLLDLCPEPDPEDPDIRSFAEDRDALRQKIYARLKLSSKRVTPVQVERELAQVERRAAGARALRAIRDAGGSAHWHSLDLTDAEQVERVMGDISSTTDRIDVWLHAAGLEVSRPLPDKSAQEFARVFDVKVAAIPALLRVARERSARAVVFFSSIAGRFGNAGQTDYAAANDLLCKVAAHGRQTASSAWRLAVDWTAWAQIGMASRGSIPEIMARAGIDMLPSERGIPLIREQLETGGRYSELLVAGALGVLESQADPLGGLDASILARTPHGPMLGEITAMDGREGLHIVTRLEPKKQRFLDDHRIDGVPVLPGVMGIEAFAEAALCVFPGYFVASVEDVQFLQPFKFYRDEPRDLEVSVQFKALGEEIGAVCRLIGRRQLPGLDAPREVTHFCAMVRLASERSDIGQKPRPSDVAERILAGEELYRFYFHGPAYQVVGCAWRSGDHVVARLADSLPEAHHPPELPLVTRPRLLELAFQAAGAQEMAEHGTLGLPSRIARVRFAPGDASGCLAVVEPRASREAACVAVVDREGRVLVSLEGYETIALPDPLDAPSLREALCP